VGDVSVGGDAPIRVQSMTNTKTTDIAATVSQIHRLYDLGCEIIRVAVPDEPAAKALADIKSQIHIPLIADIHFRHDLALMAIDSGVDGIRINPGNIGSTEKIEQVVNACRPKSIPIRIGVNSGSVEPELLKKYAGPTPVAMVESALAHIRLFEKLDYEHIKVSVKASNVMDTILSYQLLSEKVDYPLHMGVTEAGNLLNGAIKSAMGLSALLSEGIGDTIRVSLTADVAYEVKAAYEILANLGLRDRPFPEVISCPTCGRCQVNLESLANEISEKVATIRYPLTIAVMGCIVNGPGEAKEADIGVAGGNGKGVIFRQGEIVKTCDEMNIVDSLYDIVINYVNDCKQGKVKK